VARRGVDGEGRLIGCGAHPSAAGALIVVKQAAKESRTASVYFCRRLVVGALGGSEGVGGRALAVDVVAGADFTWLGARAPGRPARFVVSGAAALAAGARFAVVSTSVAPGVAMSCLLRMARQMNKPVTRAIAS